MSQHRAAQIAAVGQPAEVVQVPTPLPSESQVLVKVYAWAINPVDHVIRDHGLFVRSWPVIVGYDVAGEVLEVGSGVQSHSVGDRVLVATTAGFQELVLAPAVAATKIPDSLSFEKAVVVGLSAATAAAGLYQKDNLGLDYPSLNPKPNGKKLLVWGAGSSVAASVIQLATASGYEVIATCAPKHFEYAKRLGVSKVFDYNSPSLIDDVTAELRNGSCVGAYDGEVSLELASRDSSLTYAS